MTSTGAVIRPKSGAGSQAKNSRYQRALARKLGESRDGRLDLADLPLNDLLAGVGRGGEQDRAGDLLLRREPRGVVGALAVPDYEHG